VPREPPTLAELQGLTEEMGRAAAELASLEIQLGRLDEAGVILEGLAIANPHDPAPWAMLALLERRRGRMMAAGLCAEIAARLCPADRQVRLVQAEVHLVFPEQRGRARSALAALAGGDDPVAARARALLAALGGSPA